jgi:hypothetical protein
MVGDAIRAYLNAPSLDRNIVITAPERLHLLPRVSILNKGLYGTIKEALSFHVWVDAKMNSMGYKKCDVARENEMVMISPESIGTRMLQSIFTIIHNAN